MYLYFLVKKDFLLRVSKAAAMGCESRLRKLEQIVNDCRGSDWSALEGFQCSFIGTH